MIRKRRLFAPGPVEVPPVVLEAIARPPEHHRTPAFQQRFLRVRDGLARLFAVPGDDVTIVTGNGTTGFEAAFLAAVPEGAPVLAAHAGKFGERWARLARRHRHPVAEVAASWGRALDPDALRGALRANPDVAAVTLTHSETSTGVLHDLEALAAVVREVSPDALVVVDAVTSLAAAELRPAEWGLDVVVSGSQKGVMAPPGLAFAWLSQRAWAAPGPRAPAFALDLREERERQRDGRTGATPAVSLVAGLEAAIPLLLEDGLEALWEARARRNRALLAAGAAAGLEPFAQRPTPAVAALRTPGGVNAPDVVAALDARGVRIAGGQERTKPFLLRPSLLGHADDLDAVLLAGALEGSLRSLGHDVARGAAVAAAMAVLEEEAPQGRAIST